ncbi:hypothetical protein [Gephyromycinifex aptenodytis]|uniref:hypothetical protein n=1 Tax=Gephyromycinifex aptenodytis TaxID=2716227 RepID=UPI0014468D36|nr:hypothetical protein [Gephyromycinifex aptenodytis]
MTSTCVSATTPSVLEDRDVLEDVSLRRTRLVQALVRGEPRWSPARSLLRPLLVGFALAVLGLVVYAAVIFAQSQLRTEQSPVASMSTSNPAAGSPSVP